MPNTETNAGLSLEALLAAAQTARGEEATSEASPAVEGHPAPAEQKTPAASIADGPAQKSVPGAGTASDEPASEPSAAVQREAAEEGASATPAFDLAAALGYGSQTEPSTPARESKAPEEKFDLAAALGYKSAEPQEAEKPEAVRDGAGSEAQPVQAVQAEERPASAVKDKTEVQVQAARSEARAQTDARAQAQAVQDRAIREAQELARVREQRAAYEERKAARMAEREKRRDTAPVQADRGRRVSERTGKPDDAERAADLQVERHHVARPSTGLGAQSVADAGGKPIESYQPTKRDRSAQARAARPLKQEEVTEVVQAIAAEDSRADRSTEPVVSAEEKAAEAVVAVVERSQDGASDDVVKPIEEPSVRMADQPAAPLGEPVISSEESTAAEMVEAAVTVEQPAQPTPSVVEPVPAPQPVQSMPQPKPVDFTSAEFASSISAGAPEPQRAMPTGSKPTTTPHKVPVRTTEEIIKPVSAPVQLGVISPEAARHEAEAKKKVQSNERKIVKKVRRFRALGMLLIVIALAALAGAVFLFVAGNAQASESIETAATEICEDAGRTITYRYKAADSNGTLCPTTEVATFSAGDVLEQSVITMNTPDFETAAHTLANFKKQFQDSAYVDGRVDGSTVIFTLHMSNERIMKVTYTALLMTNTTGCEVILN